MRFGRDICGNWETASSREWLATNGLGGYACGTIALANTRRYHAFLMASLAPPVERTLLVAKVDVTVTYLGSTYPLFANEFAGGAIDPRGFVHLETFFVQDGVPVWRYAIADALLEQRLFMTPGANTSHLSLELKRGCAPVRVELKPLVTYRELHVHGRGARPYGVAFQDASCTVMAFEGACPIDLAISAGAYAPMNEWYWNFYHREESARGLDALEDLFVPGVFTGEIVAGEALFFTASAARGPNTASEPNPSQAPRALATVIRQSRRLEEALPKSSPLWVRTLATASNQFLVRRGGPGDGSSIIAGYPWFADWGRDTMIALPGLATSLARYDVAADILRTFARFVDRGMLPNVFPDRGESPEYNTADATLWLFHALQDYLAANRDPELAREFFPTLVAIIDAHVEGTRYGIQVDPGDGLLRAGQPGIHLTWMDAKQDGHVFTPRIGKPVEINALWMNALEVAARLAGRMRNDPQKRRCERLLARAAGSFERFWNPERSCLYDVIDVDGGSGTDASIRPNQIFAVSLPYSALPPARMRAVVSCCARELLTSYGLRTLSPQDRSYIGRYAGDQWRRDAAYHQGTAWAWLLGPFVRAHYRVHGDAGLAQSFLAPIAEHLTDACVGSVSEIFEGDAPHNAAGCFAQAWSVAEILRAWIQLERERMKH